MPGRSQTLRLGAEPFMQLEHPLPVFIGYDDREREAFEVARHSLARHSSIALIIEPLMLGDLRQRGLYSRGDDPLASTQFTYTRFLVPRLTHYHGHALYFDCDFLWKSDVAGLLTDLDPAKAVHCVQHDYAPAETHKMDGVRQSVYPRKNWSSLMLFNCAHEACRRLTVEAVNSAPPKYLHRFEWARDQDIGQLSYEWNWLEGHYSTAKGDLPPAAIHYTRGGPWFADWQHVDFADDWRAELALCKASERPV